MDDVWVLQQAADITEIQKQRRTLRDDIARAYAQRYIESGSACLPPSGRSPSTCPRMSASSPASRRPSVASSPPSSQRPTSSSRHRPRRAAARLRRCRSPPQRADRRRRLDRRSAGQHRRTGCGAGGGNQTPVYDAPRRSPIAFKDLLDYVGTPDGGSNLQTLETALVRLRDALIAAVAEARRRRRGGERMVGGGVEAGGAEVAAVRQQPSSRPRRPWRRRSR
jgi:hypothetical protein